MLIKQMIPATGWAALYEAGDKTTAMPLVCWAVYDVGLEEFGQESKIIGMIANGGNIVPANERDNFKSYDYDYAAAETDYLINDED